MTGSKLHYFVKLNPPRPAFAMDMDDEEKGIMLQHVHYWGKLLAEGVAIAYGPVFDLAGGYGVGIVSVESEEQLQGIIRNDPANGLNQFEYHPMRAVYRQP